ncbi:MAG: DUF1836 domain-containing protein [Lachnospiraceae bacterium]|nr:DUF1836 domain-containing protein [Lachnospiraceae bacterium]
MTLDSDNLIDSIMASLDRVKFIKTGDIPDISLYMDQVTAFIDERLKNTARHHGEDRLLTKTMINNYAKNDLIPPPDKKKYNKEHMLLLIFVYYFKNIMSISDIQEMLRPITERYFGREGDTTIASVYEEVTGIEKEQLEALKEDVREKYKVSRDTFSEVENEEEQEFLQLFSFICMLSFDVYIKKLMIEKIIDGYVEKKEKQEKKAKTKKD